MDQVTRRAVFTFGAFGGVLPTLASLASTYVTVPDTALPASGLYFGLLLWAIVGGGVALTNTSREVRQAIFAGIAAPAIIANLVSGATEAATKRKTADIYPYIASSVLGSAVAAEPTADKAPVIPGYKTLLISPAGGQWRKAIHTRSITAQIRVGDKVETKQIGELQSFEGTTAFEIPNSAETVSVLGQTLVLSQPITPVNAVIQTKPSAFGDFLWALGARGFIELKRQKLVLRRSSAVQFKSLQAPRGNRIGQIYRLRRVLAVELCDLGAQFIHAGTQLGERVAVGFGHILDQQVAEFAKCLPNDFEHELTRGICLRRQTLLKVGG